MTAGIGLPGFSGYVVGAPLPNLTQILYGVPPANSPAINVIAEPGSTYAYSGGYQAYLILLPAEGKGMVVMTNSDNGSVLAEALIRRAAEDYGWPELGELAD